MKFKKIFPISYLVYLMCLSNLTANAQHSKLDSLKHSLIDQPEDTNKVDVLLKLSFEHHQIDVSLCREYGAEALVISQKLLDTARIAQSYNCLGIASDIEGNSAKAISYWEKCLALSEKINFLTGKMKGLNNLGIALQEKGDIEKSLQYFLAALKIDEERGNIEQTINTLSNIGNLYRSINEMELAHQYLQQAIETGERVGIRSKLSHPNQRMGEYYVQTKEYETALPYLNKAYDISKEYALELRVATTLRLIGECKFYLGQRKNGIASFLEAEDLLIKIGEKYTELHHLYQTWAIIYSDIGDYKKAFEKANKGYTLATVNSLEASKLASLQLLGQLEEKVGNYQQALTYYKAASNQQDNLQLRTKEELVLELETKYQSDKKEIENELLRTQQEKIKVNLKAKNVFMNIIILVLGLVGIIALLLWRAYHIKNRYNEKLQIQVAKRTKELERSNTQLKQSNKELERFAFIASHDLKTPLSNIINFTDLLEKQLNHPANSEIQQSLSFIKKGGIRMKHLIEDVLEYSKLSAPKKYNINKAINLNTVSDDLTNTIASYLKERNAKIVIAKPLPVLIGNSSSFYLLFKNLIENAVKYNESPIPTVTISYTMNENTFSIFFKDNGIGIQEEYFEKIWEMFSRLHVHSAYEGTGLGLATCKKIMNTMDGTIHVSSILGEGATFELRFPKSVLKMQKIETTPIF